jgi:hypothetical protein
MSTKLSFNFFTKTKSNKKQLQQETQSSKKTNKGQINNKLSRKHSSKCLAQGWSA